MSSPNSPKVCNKCKRQGRCVNSRTPRRRYECPSCGVRWSTEERVWVPGGSTNVRDHRHRTDGATDAGEERASASGVTASRCSVHRSVRGFVCSEIAAFCAGVAVCCAVFTMVMAFIVGPEMRQLRKQLLQERQQPPQSLKSEILYSDGPVDLWPLSLRHHAPESVGTCLPTIYQTPPSGSYSVPVEQSQHELTPPCGGLDQRRLQQRAEPGEPEYQQANPQGTHRPIGEAYLAPYLQEAGRCSRKVTFLANASSQLPRPGPRSAGSQNSETTLNPDDTAGRG